jgi:AMP phosphorylase
MEKVLSVHPLDIEAGRYEVTLNEEDARDLGLHPRDRVRLFANHKRLVAIVRISRRGVRKGEVGVSHEVEEGCQVGEGDPLTLTPTVRPRSVKCIRRKMDGEVLTEEEFDAIIKDVVQHNLSEVELTAFITSLYIHQMTLEETASLTRKMAENGEMLELKRKPIFDKHSIGGVPGNKITLLVVPIVAAAGLTIPKTSSRAITSACGTADIMETLAPVTFSAREIEEIVNETHGIIAWGGGVNLAPADDLFIQQVEYPLSIDPYNLMICSVMAKKYAVGADFVVIDIPVGEGTKVPALDEAKGLARSFVDLGEKIGIDVECAITYGDKPIGRTVGPALEAREALLALEGGEVPSSLLEKGTEIAGMLLEAGGVAIRGNGKKVARELLQKGTALEKMREIISAQGGDPQITSGDLSIGGHSEILTSGQEGYVTRIDNRAIVQIARAAGAPRDKGAGIVLHVSKGERIRRDDPILEIYAESAYRLEQALKAAKQTPPLFLAGMVLKRIPDYTLLEH